MHTVAELVREGGAPSVIFIYNARALPLFFLHYLPPPLPPPRDCFASEEPTTTSKPLNFGPCANDW